MPAGARGISADGVVVDVKQVVFDVEWVVFDVEWVGGEVGVVGGERVGAVKVFSFEHEQWALSPVIAGAAHAEGRTRQRLRPALDRHEVVRVTAQTERLPSAPPTRGACRAPSWAARGDRRAVSARARGAGWAAPRDRTSRTACRRRARCRP